MRHLTTFIAMLFAFGFAQTAQAYTFYRCTTAQGDAPTTTTAASLAASWESNPNFRIKSDHFNEAQMDAIEWAIAEWNRGPQDLLVTSSRSTAANSSSVTDVYVSSAACSDGCSYVIQSCSAGIITADIAFKSAPSVAPNGTWLTTQWKSDQFQYGGQYASLQSCALHEIGHSLGLQHTSSEYNVMGDNWEMGHVQGSAAFAHIAPDDAQGMIALYGDEGVGNEISVSHWRRTGTNGAYSEHGFVVIEDANGNTLPSTGLPGNVVRYTVKRGTTIYPRFNFENTNGGGTVRWRYYFSTNDIISGVDTALGDVVGSFPGIGTSRIEHDAVAVPANTPLGNGYLGIAIDVENVLAEIEENIGNYSYIPINVTN